MQPFTLTVLFEEVRPVLAVDCLVTFRARITAISVRNWNIDDLESTSATGSVWEHIGAGPVRDLCFDYAISDAGYGAIENAIVEAMRKQADLAQWDVGDRAADHRFGEAA